MGITMTATGAFRETGASFFFIPKGALTHHLQSRRWYPSLRSGRALFTKHPQDASPEGGRQCRSVSLPSLSVRLAEGFRLVCFFAANCCPLSRQPATRLRKPATRSFFAEMDDASSAPSIFFCRAKRNKTAPCRGQKGSEELWRSIIWKQRS